MSGTWHNFQVLNLCINSTGPEIWVRQILVKVRWSVKWIKAVYIELLTCFSWKNHVKANKKASLWYVSYLCGVQIVGVVRSGEWVLLILLSWATELSWIYALLLVISCSLLLPDGGAISSRELEGGSKFSGLSKLLASSM